MNTTTGTAISRTLNALLGPDAGRRLRLALLAAGAGFSAFLYLREREPDQPPAAARITPGYYLRDAILEATGEDGRLLYRVLASDVRQFGEGGDIRLTDVQVAYTPSAEVPWELSATQGQMPADRTIIKLTGEVVATARAPGEAPLAIHTDYLELVPDAYVARTNGGVRVERARDTLRARGLRAYLKEDRIELETDVQGTFRP